MVEMKNVLKFIFQSIVFCAPDSSCHAGCHETNGDVWLGRLLVLSSRCSAGLFSDLGSCKEKRNDADPGLCERWMKKLPETRLIHP